MFETTFSHTSSSALPGNVSIDRGVDILHNFDTVIRFSPDCRSTKAIQPPNGKNSKSNAAPPAGQQWWEVEDDLPFIPKRLWSGGVRYQAIFVPVRDGCDITIMAPGGFTSVNHWRLVRESVPDDTSEGLSRIKSKDLLHADTGGGGWYVQITSDAKCSKTFASFVKGFLKNSHTQLQRSFVEKLQQEKNQESVDDLLTPMAGLGMGGRPGMQRQPTATNLRPAMGRRRSTGF